MANKSIREAENRINQAFSGIIKSKKPVRIMGNINISTTPVDRNPIISKMTARNKNEVGQYDVSSLRKARPYYRVLGNMLNKYTPLGKLNSIEKWQKNLPTRIGQKIGEFAIETGEGLKDTVGEATKETVSTGTDLMKSMGPIGQTVGLLHETMKGFGLDIPKIFGNIKEKFDKKREEKKEEKNLKKTELKDAINKLTTGFSEQFEDKKKKYRREIIILDKKIISEKDKVRKQELILKRKDLIDELKYKTKVEKESLEKTIVKRTSVLKRRSKEGRELLPEHQQFERSEPRSEQFEDKTESESLVKFDENNESEEEIILKQMLDHMVETTKEDDRDKKIKNGIEKLKDKKLDRLEKKADKTEDKIEAKRHKELIKKLGKKDVDPEEKKDVKQIAKVVAKVAAGVMGAALFASDLMQKDEFGKSGVDYIKEGQVMKGLGKGLFGEAPEFYEKETTGEYAKDKDDKLIKKEGAMGDAILFGVKQIAKFALLGSAIPGAGAEGAKYGAMIGVIVSAWQIIDKAFIRPLVLPLFKKLGVKFEEIGGDITEFKSGLKDNFFLGKIFSEKSLKTNEERKIQEKELSNKFSQLIKNTSAEKFQKNYKEVLKSSDYGKELKNVDDKLKDLIKELEIAYKNEDTETLKTLKDTYEELYIMRNSIIDSAKSTEVILENVFKDSETAKKEMVKIFQSENTKDDVALKEDIKIFIEKISSIETKNQKEEDVKNNLLKEFIEQMVSLQTEALNVAKKRSEERRATNTAIITTGNEMSEVLKLRLLQQE